MREDAICGYCGAFPSHHVMVCPYLKSLNEGWGLPPDARKWHYFIKDSSMCNIYSREDLENRKIHFPMNMCEPLDYYGKCLPKLKKRREKRMDMIWKKHQKKEQRDP